MAKSTTKILVTVGLALLSASLLNTVRAQTILVDPNAFSSTIKLSWKLSNNGNPDQLSRLLAEGLFPKGYLTLVLETLKQYDLDPFLVLSLIRQESAFKARVTSTANAIGLMQLIPPTAKQVAHSLGQGTPSKENLMDPVVNVRLGDRIFEPPAGFI